MNVISTCYAPLCGHRVIGKARVCPRCGGRMRSPQADRAFGLVLLGCGLFVTATMGAVTWYVAPLLAAPGVEPEGARFAGDPAQARTILQFLWLTIAFGVAAAAAGAWKIATARRGPLVTVAVLALAGLLVVAAKATEGGLA